MYAVVKVGGKQYIVKADDTIKINRVNHNAEESFDVQDVLAVGEEGGDLKFGTPFVEGASVKFRVLENKRDKTVIVFKKKKRKRYEKRNGHRQYISILKVESINA